MSVDNLIPGEAMHGRVATLLSGVSSRGDQHLAEVERDLAQMDALLGAAIEKLCDSFMAIQRSVDRQEALLQELRPQDSATEQAAAIQALREEIRRNIAAAVTGLQFQDMTSQLIGRMAGRLGGLRRVFGALDTRAAGITEIGCSETLLAALDHIGDRVDAHCDTLAAHPPSKVHQHHMDSGDIELF